MKIIYLTTLIMIFSFSLYSMEGIEKPSNSAAIPIPSARKKSHPLTRSSESGVVRKWSKRNSTETTGSTVGFLPEKSTSVSSSPLEEVFNNRDPFSTEVCLCLRGFHSKEKRK